MQLTLFSCLLFLFAGNHASEYSLSSDNQVAEPAKEAEPNSIILQSKDGGQTWQDISSGLPVVDERLAFYAGASELYLQSNGVTYSSRNDLKTPVWKKETGINQPGSIVFNRSGVMLYNYDGHIYRKDPATGAWSPIYTGLISHPVATIFETSDGTILRGTGKSLSKSVDKTLTWKVSERSWVGDIVEAEGVLVATGQKGILRSTDNGDTWEPVISEGGVGIAVEAIDGGFAAISYNAESESRRIRVSFDGGKTWKAIDKGIPPSQNISSVKQMGSDLFVGHPDGIFRSSDMGKTWQRVHAGFSSERYSMKFASMNSAPAPVEKVFKLYVSGDVLYVVGVVPGC